MSDQDELKNLILNEFNPPELGGSWRLNPTAAADAILAAGYRKPRTITTVEDLRALPIDTVIFTNLGAGSISERFGHRVIFWTGDESADAIDQWQHWMLPVTVLYTPEGE